MASKRDLNRIKELKVEIPYYGELSTSESKEKESYKKLVVELKKELEFLEKKVGKKKAWADLSANWMNDPSVQVPRSGSADIWFRAMIGSIDFDFTYSGKFSWLKGSGCDVTLNMGKFI